MAHTCSLQQGVASSLLDAVKSLTLTRQEESSDDTTPAGWGKRLSRLLAGAEVQAPHTWSPLTLRVGGPFRVLVEMKDPILHLKNAPTTIFRPFLCSSSANHPFEIFSR